MSPVESALAAYHSLIESAIVVAGGPGVVTELREQTLPDGKRTDIMVGDVAVSSVLMTVRDMKICVSAIEL